MSRNLATNCGSLDSLYRRIRWGCRPWARQMRWTELTLIPTALAMAAPVQWVACAGGPAKGKATTRSAISGLNGGMRDGRVLSRHSPAAPAEPNRTRGGLDLGWPARARDPLDRRGHGQSGRDQRQFGPAHLARPWPAAPPDASVQAVQ